MRLKMPGKGTRSLLVAAGVALFFYLIWRIGFDVLLANISRFGVWFLAILAIGALWLVLQTCAWSHHPERLLHEGALPVPPADQDHRRRLQRPAPLGQPRRRGGPGLPAEEGRPAQGGHPRHRLRQDRRVRRVDRLPGVRAPPGLPVRPSAGGAPRADRHLPGRHDGRDRPPHHLLRPGRLRHPGQGRGALSAGPEMGRKPEGASRDPRREPPPALPEGASQDGRRDRRSISWPGRPGPSRSSSS